MQQNKLNEQEFLELKEFITTLGAYLPENKAGYVWGMYNRIRDEREPQPCTCASSGAVTTYFQTNGTTDITDILKNSAYGFTLSQVLYTYGIKNTAINQVLTMLTVFPSGKVN